MLPASFLLEGELVTLVRPAPAAAKPAGPGRTASGSVAVAGGRAQVARASRIWVEGVHDAALVERIWGEDLRIEGIVVEPLGGIDELADAVAEFGPGPRRRLGVLVDHLVPGSKETRIAAGVPSPHVLINGHPYVDVWQAVKPAALGIRPWPVGPARRRRGRTASRPRSGCPDAARAVAPGAGLGEQLRRRGGAAAARGRGADRLRHRVPGARLTRGRPAAQNGVAFQGGGRCGTLLQPGRRARRLLVDQAGQLLGPRRVLPPR